MACPCTFPWAYPCVWSLRDCERLSHFCKVVGSVPKKAPVTTACGLIYSCVSFEVSQYSRHQKSRVFNLNSSSKANSAGRMRHGLDLNAEDWAGDERGWRTHAACGIRHSAARSGDTKPKVIPIAIRRPITCRKTSI
mgnify:CR=1 FL=1